MEPWLSGCINEIRCGMPKVPKAWSRTANHAPGPALHHHRAGPPAELSMSDEDGDLSPGSSPVGGSAHVPVDLRVGDHRGMLVEVRLPPSAELQALGG